MTKKGKIIFGSLWLVALLCVALFFIIKNQDRKNGYFGVYTLNFDTKKITSDTDDYVLNMKSSQPITIGINVKGIDQANIQQLTYYYADANNGTILSNKITSGSSETQYFLVPRGGEYTFGVNIDYSNKKSIQSAQIFSGPTLTIRPNLANEHIPIASLIADKQTVSLNEPITFSIVTKIASPDTTDFQVNKMIYRDFDNDGTRERKTKWTTTMYRYTQSNSWLQFTPKIAVTYDGFTWTAYGKPINIR